MYGNGRTKMWRYTRKIEERKSYGNGRELSAGVEMNKIRKRYRCETIKEMFLLGLSKKEKNKRMKYGDIDGRGIE